MPGVNSSPSPGPSSASTISTSLLEGLRAHDHVAWDRLVRLFGKVVYQWARKKGLQPSDAEDTVQDVLARVAGHIHDFQREKPTDTFRGWIWRITDNAIKDYWRGDKKRPVVPGSPEMHEQIQQLAESEYKTADGLSVDDANCLLMQEVLARTQESFDEKTWKVFWMFAVEGHSSAEVGEFFGMQKNAVRQAKFRVMKRIREEFENLT